MATKLQKFTILFLCCIWILITPYLLIFHLHNLTCYIHPYMCKPWTEWLKKLRNPYDAMTQQQFNSVVHQMWHEQNITDSPACKNSSFIHKCPNRIKWGILLAQRHGGSNWVIGELNKYKQIIVKNELLLAWENYNCSKWSQWMESTQCNQDSLIKELDTIYNQAMDKLKHYCLDKEKKKVNGGQFYFIWKVQIGQIPPDLFRTLIDYIYCHDIMVLHLIREASVASFWSIQAQTVERVYTADLDKTLNKEHRSMVPLEQEEHINALQLDPFATLKFVNNIDTNRKMLGKLIKLYPGYIKYQQYDYEDLIGESSERYWDSILIWIGGPNLKLFKKNQDSVAKLKKDREHPNSCFTRITNWRIIKQMLKGYDSYYACEKYHS